MSYHLRQNGREHVILERGRVAERWRSERWESLSFQFPNWMVRLPGYAYDGDQPEGFMGRDDVVSFISNYARQCSAPIRCGVNASSVSQSSQGRLVVQAGQNTMEAPNVIVATGPYQLPSIPLESARLPAGIQQVTANRYTCAAELPPGNILVVGSGGSGAQIVEDLVHEGRSVYFSVRRHRLIPRRYRGHDVGWWLEQTGMTDRTLETIPPDWRAPLMTGVNGGRTVDLRDMARHGVTLVGSLRDIRDGRVFFAADLNANLSAGDVTFSRFIQSIDEYVSEHGIDALPKGEYDTRLQITPASLPEVEELDITAANITTVIWATGYRHDFSWINCPVFNEKGIPVHRRGVTAVPGLFFLGLPRMHKIKSAFLWGVGEDSAYLAQQVLSR
jgi:putative flavoprotein involved in K+ transport